MWFLKHKAAQQYIYCSTKTLFLIQENYYKFQLQNSKSETLSLMCLEILLNKHNTVIKVPEIVKQTVKRK